MKRPRVRFTIRGLMVAVALVAAVLGLSLEAIRLRRLAAVYQTRGATHAALESKYHRNRSRREAERGGFGWVASVAFDEIQIVHHHGLAQVYRDAATHPWRTVAPEPPPPTMETDPAAFRAAIIRVALQSRDADQLDLSFTPISDEDLARLGELRNLNELHLGHTHVTDAGLHHLKALSKLRRVELFRSEVTPKGATRLAAEMPGLTVGY